MNEWIQKKVQKESFMTIMKSFSRNVTSVANIDANRDDENQNPLWLRIGNQQKYTPYRKQYPTSSVDGAKRQSIIDNRI